MNTEASKLRVLIADSDQHFSAQLARHLNSFSDMEVIAIEQDGHAALKRILSAQPDIFFFDLVLPGMDGLSLLHEISGMDVAPATIGCTRLYSDVSVEAARSFGISYLMYKPVDVHSLHSVLVSCADIHRRLVQQSRYEEENLDLSEQAAETRNYLVSLGIPTKMVGCSYLVEAIRLARGDATLMRNLSKGLYLEIARCMDSTPSRIERCIRNAIEHAYRSGELRSRMKNCPSNKEFINYILRNIHS